VGVALEMAKRRQKKKKIASNWEICTYFVSIKKLDNIEKVRNSSFF